MTPKQAAHDLYVSFFNIGNINRQDAKQCALVAVDEILSVLDGFSWTPTIEYWQQVKTEIEKL